MNKLDKKNIIISIGLVIFCILIEIFSYFLGRENIISFNTYLTLLEVKKVLYVVILYFIYRLLLKKYIDNKKLYIFLGLSLSFLLFEIVYIIIGIDLKNLTTSNYMVLMLIKYIFFLGMLCIIYRKYLKEKFIDLKNNFHKYMRITFKNWFLGFIVMYICNIIIITLLGNIGENENNVQELIKEMPIFAFFLTTFFAPIIEEIIFRKSLGDVFKNKNIYPIFSGFIFGLIHVIGSVNLWEYLLIIPYGAPGYFFAKTINETDNVYNTIIVHMFHNGILTIISMVIR